MKLINESFIIKEPKYNVGFLSLFAMISMLIEHINFYLLDFKFKEIENLSRVSFPLFCFIFSYNLATKSFLFHPILNRLFLTFLISTIVYLYLGNNYFNVILIYIFFLFIIKRFEYSFNELNIKDYFFILILIFSVQITEYNIQGLFFILLNYFYFKNFHHLKKTYDFIFLMTISIFIFQVNNYNYYVFLFPIIVFFSNFIKNFSFRIRYLNYYFYPIHLLLICFIKKFV